MKITDNRRKKLFQYSFFYMLITLCCVIFGAVYESFGHGVYSYRMIYAFTAPFVLGAILLFVIALRARKLPGALSLLLWNCGIATLTVGLLFHGVLDIYGTTSKLVLIYYIASGILLITGILLYLFFDKQIEDQTEVDRT